MVIGIVARALPALAPISLGASAPAAAHNTSATSASSGDLEMSRSHTIHTAASPKIGGTPSARAWFAGGERVGYDPKARAIIVGQGAPLEVFLRREGDLAHAMSFLPGYPDGSFGWAKVLPHLPSAAEMPKLFVEYVGMGDSDKPKTYA